MLFSTATFVIIYYITMENEYTALLGRFLGYKQLILAKVRFLFKEGRNYGNKVWYIKELKGKINAQALGITGTRATLRKSSWNLGECTLKQSTYSHHTLITWPMNQTLLMESNCLTSITCPFLDVRKL